MENKKQLKFLIFIFPLVTLFLYGLLSYMFMMYTQKENAKHEIVRYKETLMQIHKTALKEKLNSLAQFIHYYDNKTSYKIREDSEYIVKIATSIANNIIEKYENKLPESEIKSLIKEALANLTFEEGIGYLFILDNKGKVYINKNNNMIAKDLEEYEKTSRESSMVKEFEKATEDDKEEEGSYVDYYWYVPGLNKDKQYYKISYVKKIEKFGWYVGAGEYLDLMKKRIRHDVLEYVEDNYRFKHGYLFVSDSKNNIIFAPKESNITKEALKKYRMDGVYHDDKTLAYTKYIPEYDWYIIAVKDLKDVKKSLELKKQENEKNFSDNIKTNLYIMFATWFLSIILSIYLSVIISKLLRKYDDQLKETNEKLIFQSRQALLGELLPMIAHQWRQPINKIASVIALLRFDDDERTNPEKLDKHYQQIEDNIEFMSETIDDFREFYKPKHNVTEANLKELVEKSINLVDSAIKKKNIKLIKKLEDITHKVFVNEFLQVMINLIKNAVDALDEGGTIEVKLFKNKQGLIVIEVIDNGKGIKKEMLEKIFEPYVTTKKSMGLGLYMSKIIIEKHMRGELTASNTPDGGAKFTITLKAE